MARRIYTNQDIFKAILQVGPEGTKTAVARELGVSLTGLHRRLRELEEAGVITCKPFGLNPSAIDAASEHRYAPAWVEVAFEDGRVKIKQRRS